MYQDSDFEQRQFEAQVFRRTSDSERTSQPSKPKQDNSTKLETIPYLIRFIVSCILTSRVRERVVKHRSLLCQFMPNLQKSVGQDSAAVNRAIAKLSEHSDVEVRMLAKSLKSNVFIIQNLAVLTVSSIVAVFLIIYLVAESQRQLQTISNRRNTREQQATRPQSAQSPSRDRNAPNPTPTPTINPFYEDRFPKRACGDSLPSNPSRYPVRFYPVFANYSERNLSRVSNGYCQDAYGPVIRENGQRSIQVASFISRDTAELFRDFMSDRVPQARWEIGEPNTFDSPP